MDLNDLVKGLLTEVGRIAKSDVVVGQVRDAGTAKVLPLSRVSIGFGVGTAGVDGKAKRESLKGDADLHGGGAGGAIVVEPKAFVVVGEDGIPHMLALKGGKAAVLRRGLELTTRIAEALPAGKPTAKAKHKALAASSGSSKDD